MEAQKNFYLSIRSIREEAAVFGEIPLIVGGRTFDHGDVRRVLACGADGVQLATRFAATEVCGEPLAFKEASPNCR